METPWELEARDSDRINGEYKTDSGEESIITGGNGIPFKKVTKLTETWHQMERLVSQGVVKVRFTYRIIRADFFSSTIRPRSIACFGPLFIELRAIKVDQEQFYPVTW